MGHHNEQEANNADNLNLQNLKAENSATVNISQTDGVGIQIYDNSSAHGFVHFIS